MRGKGKIALLIVAVVALLFLSPPAFAQSAKVYVDSAVAAMGGLEALLALKSQRIVSHGENFEPAQTRRPGAEPRKVSRFTCTLLRDLISGRVRYEWQRKTFFPFPANWRYTEIIDGYEGVILGRDGIRSPPKRAISAARIAARRKELGRSAVSVLLHALSRSNSFLRLMDQLLYGRPHAVVSYNDNGHLVILAIDTQSRLLTKIEFLEDDPLHGDTHNELFLTDWRQVGALQLPFALTYRVNGQVVMTEHIDSIENDVELSAADFTLPEEIDQSDAGDNHRGAFSSHWLLRRIALASPLDEEQTHVRLVAVAPGVHHITGGTHHSLVIELTGYLIVVEAPLYDERSESVLAALTKKFPGKPVRFIVNTHFHHDHAGGLRAYVAAGATIVTSKANEEFFQRALSAPRTRAPYRVRRKLRPAVIETVDAAKKTFSDGKRVVEIYPVRNSHAEGMLVVYLPQEKLLFVTDLFTPGAPRQMQVWCQELLAALEQYGLAVERIVGGHGGVGTFAELRQAVSPNGG